MIAEGHADTPIAVARVAFNDEYYEQFYTDFLPSKTRYRKHAVSISCAILASGMGALAFFGTNLLTLTAVAIGILDLLETLTHRWRWRLWAKTLQEVEEVELEFTLKGIHKQTRKAREDLDYECFILFIEAEQGFFLRIARGWSLYVPKRSLAPDEVDTVLQMLRNKIPSQ